MRRLEVTGQGTFGFYLLILLVYCNYFVFPAEVVVEWAHNGTENSIVHTLAQPVSDFLHINLVLPLCTRIR